VGRSGGAGATSAAPVEVANEVAALKCPVCTADRSPNETANRIYGRDASDGDYFVCVCTSVLLMKRGELVEPTAADLFELTPAEYSLLWHARKRAARDLQRAQGGRI